MYIIIDTTIDIAVHTRLIFQTTSARSAFSSIPCSLKSSERDLHTKNRARNPRICDITPINHKLPEMILATSNTTSIIVTIKAIRHPGISLLIRYNPKMLTMLQAIMPYKPKMVPKSGMIIMAAQAIATSSAINLYFSPWAAFLYCPITLFSSYFLFSYLTIHRLWPPFYIIFPPFQDAA